MIVTRCMCFAKPFATELDYGADPIQSGLGGSPWHVAVASMLLCRTRGCQVRKVLKDVFSKYPTPGHMEVAEDLECMLAPCGLQRNRSRQLRRFSQMWRGAEWVELHELPGVGLYVNDAVGLFCFGCTELESSDHVLAAYAATVRGGTPV